MRMQLGWRLPRLVVDRFTELCKKMRLRPSEVVEEFMRRALEIGDVEEALNMIQPGGEKALLAREMRARAIMSSIQGSIKNNDFSGEVYDEYQMLLLMLPGLRDPRLIEDVRELGGQVNKALREG